MKVWKISKNAIIKENDEVHYNLFVLKIWVSFHKHSITYEQYDFLNLKYEHQIMSHCSHDQNNY
jgi:hypothetical protein